MIGINSLVADVYLRVPGFQLVERILKVSSNVLKPLVLEAVPISVSKLLPDTQVGRAIRTIDRVWGNILSSSRMLVRLWRLCCCPDCVRYIKKSLI